MLGFGIFGVWDLWGFGVSGFSVQGFFSCHGLGFRVQDLGFVFL